MRFHGEGPVAHSAGAIGGAVSLSFSQPTNAQQTGLMGQR